MMYFQKMFRYSDWANLRLLDCCTPLTGEQLDHPFEIGSGSLRKTLIHLYNGEHVWLERWQGKAEVSWPDESEPLVIATLRERFQSTFAARAKFLDSLEGDALPRVIRYRDSRGTWYQAALCDMLMQVLTHSIHHRAQCVNMLRRLQAEAPELDYMYWVRKPA